MIWQYHIYCVMFQLFIEDIRCLPWIKYSNMRRHENPREFKFLQYEFILTYPPVGHCFLIKSLWVDPYTLSVPLEDVNQWVYLTVILHIASSLWAHISLVPYEQTELSSLVISPSCALLLWSKQDVWIKSLLKWERSL